MNCTPLVRHNVTLEVQFKYERFYISFHFFGRDYLIKYPTQLIEF